MIMDNNPFLCVMRITKTMNYSYDIAQTRQAKDFGGSPVPNLGTTGCAVNVTYRQSSHLASQHWLPLDINWLYKIYFSDAINIFRYGYTVDKLENRQTGGHYE